MIIFRKKYISNYVPPTFRLLYIEPNIHWRPAFGSLILMHWRPPIILFPNPRIATPITYMHMEF